MASYKIYLSKDTVETNSISKNSIVKVADPLRKEEYYLKVKSIEQKSDLNYKGFSKLKAFIKSLSVPFKDKASFLKWLWIGVVYSSLSLLRSAFIRGWRIQVIKRMVNDRSTLVPPIQKLHEIGHFIKDGLKLLLARLFWEIPRIFFLVAFGYTLLDFALSSIIEFFTLAIGGSDRSFGEFLTESLNALAVNYSIELIFFVLISFIIIPAYRIMEIRYSVGEVSYQAFFNFKEIKCAFRLYRKYSFKTIGIYLWDVVLTVVSVIFGLLSYFIFFIAAIFTYPFVKLATKHYPKMYAYGLLALEMYENGDLHPKFGYESISE